jgi:hypothetical protein
MPYPEHGSVHAAGAARRRWPRLLVEGRLQARIPALDLEVVLRDLSYGGFALEAPVPFTYGDTHEFLVSTDAGWSATLRAKAVHCHGRGAAGPYLVGWQCLADRDTVEAIGRLMDGFTSALSFD